MPEREMSMVRGLNDITTRICASAALWWAIYFAALLAVALPKGLATEVRFLGQLLPLLANTTEMERLLGGADAGAYIRGAWEILRHGWFKDTSYEVLWAPGYFLMHVLVLGVVGWTGPALLALVILTAGVWAIVLLLVRQVALISLKAGWACLLPLVFLPIPFFREYFLRNGTVSSESLSTAFWAMGLLVLLLAVARPSIWLAIFGGLAFALGAYVRGQIDIVVLIGVAIVAADALLFALYGSRLGTQTSVLQQFWSNRQLVMLLVAAITFIGATAPYRIYKAARHGTFMFTSPEYYYKYLWMHPDEYPPIAGFILRGGGPVACHVEPRVCAEIRKTRETLGEDVYSYKFYKRMAVLTFLSRPASWIRYRLAHVRDYWFSKPTEAFPAGRDPVTGYVLAFAMALNLLIWPFAIARRFRHLFVLTLLTVYLGSCATFAFIHYEVRYLYFIQFASVLLFVVGLVGWRAAKQAMQSKTPIR
jgi:hypothetical protein